MNNTNNNYCNVYDDDNQELKNDNNDYDDNQEFKNYNDNNNDYENNKELNNICPKATSYTYIDKHLFAKAVIIQELITQNKIILTLYDNQTMCIRKCSICYHYYNSNNNNTSLQQHYYCHMCGKTIPYYGYRCITTHYFYEHAAKLNAFRRYIFYLKVTYI